MKSLNIIAAICFRSEPLEQMQDLKNLLDFHKTVDGTSGYTVIDATVADEEVILDINKGFQCITIALKDIETLLATKES